MKTDLALSPSNEKLRFMREKSFLILVLSFGFLGLQLGLANATTFLELQSTYLGDGWFQYKMSVMNDPFFREADITGFGMPFTNQARVGTNSSEWINKSTNGYSSWSF